MGATAHDSDARTAVRETEVKQVLNEKAQQYMIADEPTDVIVRSINGYRESGTRVTEVYEDSRRKGVLQVFLPTNGTPLGHLMVLTETAERNEYIVEHRFTSEGTEDVMVVSHENSGRVNLGSWEDSILEVFEQAD